MEDRQIFSCYEIKNSYILFSRTLGNTLESKLSLNGRQKTIDAFFIPPDLKIRLSSISHHVFWISQLPAGKVGTKARDSSPACTAHVT